MKVVFICSCLRIVATMAKLAVHAFCLAAVVHSLRKMRRGMVQTLDQYEFIYKAVLQELERIK